MWARKVKSLKKRTMSWFLTSDLQVGHGHQGQSREKHVPRTNHADSHTSRPLNRQISLQVSFEDCLVSTYGTFCGVFGADVTASDVHPRAANRIGVNEGQMPREFRRRMAFELGDADNQKESDSEMSESLFTKVTLGRCARSGWGQHVRLAEMLQWGGRMGGFHDNLSNLSCAF